MNLHTIAPAPNLILLQFLTAKYPLYMFEETQSGGVRYRQHHETATWHTLDDLSLANYKREAQNWHRTGSRPFA